MDFVASWLRERTNVPVMLLAKKRRTSRGLGAEPCGSMEPECRRHLSLCGYLPRSTPTLPVSLGSFRTAYDAVTVIIGVVLVAALGEVARQIRLHGKRTLELTSRPAS